MRKHLFRWGLLCLVVLVACVARAQEPNIQEKELYTTDFTEWPEINMKTATGETHSVSTKYSKETLTFTFTGVGVYPEGTNSKFADHCPGYMEVAKYSNEYTASKPVAETSALTSLTKIVLTQCATGGSRGIKVSVKGDGDADWVVLHDAYIGTQSGEVLTLTFDERKNCKIKFESLADGQNAYVTDLALYGNVDMSKYPALGSFSYNGVTYTAGDIFDEVSDGVQEATIELFNDVPLPSTSNPLQDIVCDNGAQDGDITYTPQADGSVVAAIKVAANGETVTYNAIFKHKPYFTLTYLDTDGAQLGTQSVEKDRAISSFAKGEADVKVADGKAFRGWFVSADGGEKYTTDYVVTSDLNLYAVATDVEVESTTERYTFNLTDQYFYDEDHEAFNAAGDGTGYHDGTHGWVLKAKDDSKIDLLVGGNAYIVLGLCNQSKGDLVLSNNATDWTENITGKASKDGETYSVEYAGAAGTLTLTATGGDVYLHKIVIANVEDSPVETNEEGYYIVRPGDGGNLLTVLDVANSKASADKRTMIFLPDGTYDLGSEVLTPISGDNISIIGQSMDNTVIVNEAPQEGIGVSATFFITGSGTYMQDLTLKNAYDYYGMSGNAGRAVVIQDKGDRTIFKNVRMLSYQDTYYPNNNGQYYLENSDIHGTVDFICGEGDVFFNNCTLTVEPRSLGGSGECTITAPSTDVAGGSEWGYVFSNCTIDNKAESFNFGRAWNNRPRCAFLNTTIKNDKLINTRWRTSGVNAESKPDRFVEYNSMDENGNVTSPAENGVKFDGTSTEVNTIISADEAARYTVDNVFPDWTPDEYAAQKELGLLKAESTRLTWDAVDGVTAYAVFLNGKFVAMTSTNSYDITEGEADDYTVRAANAHGGFGRPASTTYTSGIDAVEAEGDVVSTAYYSIQGSRVSNAYKGIVIKVDTMADGTVKTTKMMK